MALIGFGTFKSYYTYIFVLVFFKFLTDSIEGLNEKNYYEYYEDPKKETIYNFGSIFSYHPLFQNFMNFFAAIILGIILYVIYLKTEKEPKGRLTIEKITDMRTKFFGLELYPSYLDITITSLIYALNILIRSFLVSMKFDAGFWTLEILFIIYLSQKILKVKIGNHQKVTIFILAFLSFAIQIVNSLLPKTDHDCEDEQCLDEYIMDNNLYIFITKKFGHFGYIFLIFFLYIIHFMMRDYSWVRLKYILDIKSVPIFKVMLYIGIVGCSLIIICLVTVTNAPCNFIENIEKINGTFKYIDTNRNIDFQRQICGIIDYDNEAKKLTFYYDNFNIFFEDYANSNMKILEIFMIPIYLIINIMINFCNAMILKLIDANAMLVNINFNFLISRTITYIINKGSKGYLTVTEFILLQLCELLAILAYMIYIELIELKFCRLDYHLKKRIEQRSIDEAKLYLDENSDEEDEDDNVNKSSTINEEDKSKSEGISYEMVYNKNMQEKI